MGMGRYCTYISVLLNTKLIKLETEERLCYCQLGKMFKILLFGSKQRNGIYIVTM